MENNNNNQSIKKDENTLNLLSVISPENIDNININQEINQKNDENYQKSSIKKSIQLNSSIDSEDYKSAKSHMSFFSVHSKISENEKNNNNNINNNINNNNNINTNNNNINNINININNNNNINNNIINNNNNDDNNENNENKNDNNIKSKSILEEKKEENEEEEEDAEFDSFYGSLDNDEDEDKNNELNEKYKFIRECIENNDFNEINQIENEITSEEIKIRKEKHDKKLGILCELEKQMINEKGDYIEKDKYNKNDEFYLSNINPEGGLEILTLNEIENNFYKKEFNDYEYYLKKN